MTKDKFNPYLLCYKRRASASARQKLIMIEDDNHNDRSNSYKLPDFWYMQLKNGIERPFVNQFICHHNRLKPSVNSKLKLEKCVSRDVYEDLCHFYSPLTFLEK